MKSTTDYKMGIYAFVIALLASLIRIIYRPEIADGFAIGIAIALSMIALALSFWEIKEKLEFFYAYGENWNGGYIFNSGFILALSNYFLPLNLIYSIISAVLLSLVFIIYRILVRKAVAETTKER